MISQYFMDCGFRFVLQMDNGFISQRFLSVAPGRQSQRGSALLIPIKH